MQIVRRSSYSSGSSLRVHALLDGHASICLQANQVEWGMRERRGLGSDAQL